jgi:hypothetical protein
MLVGAVSVSSLSLRAQNHLSVGDAGLTKHRPDTSKTCFLIKSYDRNLRVEKNRSGIISFSEAHGLLQKLFSSSFPAIRFHNCHSPNLCAFPAHDHSCRPDRLSSLESEKMKCSIVVPIQFDLLRHPLFFYEHAHADAKSLLQFFFGAGSLDSNSPFHRISVCRGSACIARRKEHQRDSMMLTGSAAVFYKRMELKRWSGGILE